MKVKKLCRLLTDKKIFVTIKSFPGCFLVNYEDVTFLISQTTLKLCSIRNNVQVNTQTRSSSQYTTISNCVIFFCQFSTNHNFLFNENPKLVLATNQFLLYTLWSSVKKFFRKNGKLLFWKCCNFWQNIWPCRLCRVARQGRSRWLILIPVSCLSAF